MSDFTNPLSQPVGRPLPGWTAPPVPPREPIEGRTCRIEMFFPARHAAKTRNRLTLVRVRPPKVAGNGMGKGGDGEAAQPQRPSSGPAE